MPRIRCHYVNCVFLDEGYCSAAAVEVDPDEGCLTYSESGEVAGGDVWDDEDEMINEDWDEEDFVGEDDDDDFWLDGDDDF